MRDIPRGKGYDKSSITKHLGIYQVYQEGQYANGNAYARKNGMIPDFFERSLDKYFPLSHKIPFLYNSCQYCKRSFAYSVKTQRFCSPKCASDKKRDKEYFAGNRRNTVGLAEKICQICGANPKKGIASHHVFGKAKDPKGKTLVALCPSCHDLVTKLGIRISVNDPVFWEKLQHYSKLRRNGPE